jgi:hypothetical protein
MNIQNTQFNLIYPPIADLRRRVFELEDCLSDSFSVPFNLAPIPDEAPAEIPRITTNSHRGHSTLAVSLNSAQFSTRYDDNFSSDWEKCLVYVQRRIEGLVRALNSFVKDNFLFSGLSTSIIMDLSQEPIDLLIDKFLCLKSNYKPFDIEFKSTFIIDEQYYVNISLGNVRTFENYLLGTTNNIVPLISLKPKKEMLGITIDINDRYGYNYSNHYTSGLQQVSKIISLTDDIIRNKLNNMVLGGEIII